MSVRRVVAGCVLTVLVFAASAFIPVLAHHNRPHCEKEGGVWTKGDGGRGTYLCVVVEPDVPDPGPSDDPVREPPEPDDTCEVHTCYFVRHYIASTEPDGYPCYRIEVRRYLDELPLGVLVFGGEFWYFEQDINWYDNHARAGQEPHECRGPEPDIPAPTPEDVEEVLVDQVLQEVPAPTLNVDPGEVVTGLPAFLEAQWDDDPAPLDPDCAEHAGQPEHRFAPEYQDGTCEQLPDDVRLRLADMELEVNGVPMAVTLDAVARYVVDWGDGSPVEEFRVEGLPYPDGQVRHTYQSVPPEGQVTIAVQEYWTVVWTVEALGTFPLDGELQPPPSLFDVPVTEVQAVVN